MSGRLADAILVARDLLNRHPEVTIDRIPAHAQIGPDCHYPRRGVPVFANEGALASSIQKMVASEASSLRKIEDFDIRIKHIPAEVAQIVPSEEGEFKSPERIMRSILLRYEARADILLLDNLNPCWKRFAMCKEFAHLVMDEGQGTRAVSVDEQIIMAYTISRDPKPEKELTSEEFAWFVAVELMLPWRDRLEMMSRQGAGESHLSLARSYWIPKALVDLFFETPYWKMSNQIKD